MGEAAQMATERVPQHAQYAFQLQPSTAAASAISSAMKAKRRRTTPQDHAVLEAAYLRNSKPDKSERIHIVSQVSLGEKEVQIWFQNRRQNDRRRSQPLQPHELVAHLRNTAGSPVPPQPSSSPTTSSEPRAQVSLTPAESIDRPASRASSIHDLLNPADPPVAGSKATKRSSSGLSTPPPSFEEKATKTTTSAGVVETSGSDASSDKGSAKKRTHDEMIGFKTLVEGQAKADTMRPKESIARSSSFVRLAMTVDGAVKVRTSNEPTPSPEKSRTTPLQTKVKTPMNRSKSALGGIEIFHDSTQGVVRAVGTGYGRSRDSRTWEFFCDSTARDALSTQAEAESSGSAVSAINLIRSNSFKSRGQALSPSLSKTNVRSMSSKYGKPKLSRAKSSLGRLQGLNVSVGPGGEKDKSRRGHVRSPSGDSDKENWAPGTTDSEHVLRRTQPTGSQRPILQENEDMTFPDASSSRKRRDGGTPTRQSPTKGKAKGEDLDCIQSLLSLKQAAWTKE